jgi:2,4-dienoyl-CoA reductase-like NADH-dependent reductase (Old Yellow Enzyme family)
MKRLATEMTKGVHFSEDTSILGNPIHIEDFTIPNRMAIQPLEAADSDMHGTPMNRTRERYLDYARGCAGLIWFEACSIDFPEARSHDSMLVISEENVEAYRSIVEEVKEVSRESLKTIGLEGRALLVLQLSHAGRYRVHKNGRSPAISFRFPRVDEAFGITENMGRVVTDSELEDIKDAFIRASKLAIEAGFDAVDIKACHGYLLNDLLTGADRKGRYGGETFDKKTKFQLETMKAVVEETEGMVTSRMNAYDGFPSPYGFGSSSSVSPEGLAHFNPSEPAELIRRMQKLGVKFVNISLGNPYFSQFLTRPFDTKMPGQKESPFHPIKGVERHFEIVATLKKEVPGILFLGAGYSWLREHGVNAAAHNIEQSKVDLAGWGRLAIANPGFPKEILQDGKLNPNKVCVTCSGCSRLLRAGMHVGCIVQNPEAYRESLKKLNQMGK